MAKWNRKQIGTVMKRSADKEKFPAKYDKDGKVLDPGVREFTIKITEDCSFKAGEYINLENRAYKIASLNAAKGKMSEEVFEKMLERAENTPEWVFFEMIKVSRNND